MADETQAPDVKRVAKKLLGVVVSDKRRKTITVEVRRLVKHPLYGKYRYRSTRFHAHDEKNEAKVGDRVELASTRPLSRLKRWRLTRIVERAVSVGPIELFLPEVEVPGPKAALAQPPAAVPPAPAEGAPFAAKAPGEGGVDASVAQSGEGTPA